MTYRHVSVRWAVLWDRAGSGRTQSTAVLPGMAPQSRRSVSSARTPAGSPEPPCSPQFAESWMGYSGPGHGVLSLGVSEKHVWCLDYRGGLFCSALRGAGLRWQKFEDAVQQVAVSPSGSPFPLCPRVPPSLEVPAAHSQTAAPRPPPFPPPGRGGLFSRQIASFAVHSAVSVDVQSEFFVFLF